MKKKILSLVIICAVVLCMSATVMAANQDFKFVVSSGGASDYTYATVKSGGTAWELAYYMTPKTSSPSYPNVTSNWVLGETFRMRVRDNATRSPYSNLKSVTRSATITYGVTQTAGYTVLPTAGTSYRLYVDKPSTDKYGSLTLVGTWCP